MTCETCKSGHWETSPLAGTPIFVHADGSREVYYECDCQDDDADETLPLVTIAGNGYALLVESPTGIVAITLHPQDADRLFTHGINYCETVTGDRLSAVRETL